MDKHASLLHKAHNKSYSTRLGVQCNGLNGAVTHQGAVPVQSISRCALNHHNLFYQIQNVLAFNWDTCCHLVLCLRLLPFHGASLDTGDLTDNGFNYSREKIQHRPLRT